MGDLLVVVFGLLVVAMPLAGIFVVLNLQRRMRAAEDALRRLEQDRRAPTAAAQVPERITAPASTGLPPPTPRSPPSQPAHAAQSPQPSSPESRAVLQSAGLAVPSPSAAAPPPRRDGTLESFVGGRLLLVGGVVAVLFALGFFLKIAIDRGWIGPALRVGLGVTAGVLLLWRGDRLRLRGLAAFGHALMGAGLGALFLCVFFSARRYGFLSPPAAFGCVALVTAAGAALAVWRSAPTLAWLGFAGGYLAPALLGQGHDALQGLTGWLIVLHLGLVVVLLRRPWPGLEFLALAASAALFGAWHRTWMAPDRVAAAGTALALLVLAQFALCVLPGVLRRRTMSRVTLAAAGQSLLWATIAGAQLCFPEQRLALGAALAGLGVLHGAAALAHTRGRVPRRADGLVLAALALAALATALPVAIRGPALPPAWAFAGLAAVVLGSRKGVPLFTWSGLALIALAALDVLARRLPLHDGPFTLLHDGPFLAALAPGVAALLAAGELGRHAQASRRTPAAAVLGAWWVALFAAIEAYDVVLVAFPLPPELMHATWARGRAAASVALALAAVVLARRPARVVPRAAPDWTALGPLGLAVVAVLLQGVRGRIVPWTPVLNPIFGAGVLTLVATLVVARAMQPNARRVLAVAATLLLLQLLRTEIHVAGELLTLVDGTREDSRLAAQVGISVAWALLAATLVALGFQRRVAELRWMGLAVFAITAGKVVLHDMARLDLAWRVGSFLALGLLLVAASLLYHRARRDGSRP